MVLPIDKEVDTDGERERVSTNDTAVSNVLVDDEEMIVTSIADAMVSNDKEVDSDGEENIIFSLIDITLSDILEVSIGDADVVVISVVDAILSNVDIDDEGIEDTSIADVIG